MSIRGITWSGTNLILVGRTNKTISVKPANNDTIATLQSRLDTAVAATGLGGFLRIKVVALSPLDIRVALFQDPAYSNASYNPNWWLGV